MSEEEESNNENEENEEEEDNEEGEEKDDDENEDDEGEGEENEDDEGGEEGENEEGEEKEDEEEEDDEEDDKKKKKGKKGGKKNDKEEKKEKEEEKPNSKFSEDKLHPSKEIKMDLNLNTSNSNNIYFNGNDITLANIPPPKKTTLQLLTEISTEMDTLSTHLEDVLPKEKPLKYNVMYPISNTIISPTDIPYPNDKQDLEIKKLIERANELTNDSILNKKREENGETKIKTYEDKCCQSDDEIEYSYNQQLEENRSREEDYYNKNYNTDNVNNLRRFPYDPYKHLGYYNDLRNNNDFRRRSLGQIQRGYNNNINNINNNNYRNNFKGNDVTFERYKPGSVAQAMDILLDNK